LFLKAKRQGKFKVEKQSIKYLLKEAFPIGIARLLNSSREKIGPVLLGFMNNVTAVAFYSVGYKLFCIANVVPYMLYRAIFPNMTNALKDRSPEAVEQYLRKIFKMVSLMAVPLSFLVYYNAEILVNLIFGKNFGQGIIVLQIMIWMTALILFNRVYRKNFFWLLPSA